MSEKTHDELRSELAILLGYKKYPYAVINGTRYDIETWAHEKMKFNPDRPTGGTSAGWNTVPDFLGSRDAAIKAIQTLAEKEPEGERPTFWEFYCDALTQQTGGMIIDSWGTPHDNWGRLLTATAEEITKAILYMYEDCPDEVESNEVNIEKAD